MDQGLSLKEALKNVVEKKLMGTWKLAVISIDHPEVIYFVKNSGEILIGKTGNSVIVSSEEIVFGEESGNTCEVFRVPNNHLVELKDDCTYTIEKLERKVTVDRNPKQGYDHIFEEEIYESADAVNQAIDFGQKFVSNH